MAAAAAGTSTGSASELLLLQQRVAALEQERDQAQTQVRQQQEDIERAQRDMQAQQRTIELYQQSRKMEMTLTLNSALRRCFPAPSDQCVVHIPTKEVPRVVDGRCDAAAGGAIGGAISLGGPTAVAAAWLGGPALGIPATLAALLGGSFGAAVSRDEASKRYQASLSRANEATSFNTYRQERLRQFEADAPRASQVIEALFRKMRTEATENLLDPVTGELYFYPVRLSCGCVVDLEGNIDTLYERRVCPIPTCGSQIEGQVTCLDKIESINAIVKQMLSKLEWIVKHPTNVVVNASGGRNNEVEVRLRDGVEQLNTLALKTACERCGPLGDVDELVRKILTESLTSEEADNLLHHLKAKVEVYNNKLKEQAKRVEAACTAAILVDNGWSVDSLPDDRSATALQRNSEARITDRIVRELAGLQQKIEAWLKEATIDTTPPPVEPLVPARVALPHTHSVRQRSRHSRSSVQRMNSAVLASALSRMPHINHSLRVAVLAGVS